MDWVFQGNRHGAVAVVFRVKEQFGDLSNMSNVFPLLVQGIPVKSSEALVSGAALSASARLAAGNISCSPCHAGENGFQEAKAPISFAPRLGASARRYHALVSGGQGQPAFWPFQ